MVKLEQQISDHIFDRNASPSIKFAITQLVSEVSRNITE